MNKNKYIFEGIIPIFTIFLSKKKKTPTNIFTTQLDIISIINIIAFKKSKNISSAYFSFHISTADLFPILSLLDNFLGTSEWLALSVCSSRINYMIKTENLY